MASLNQCNFIGNLGKDPEIRYMPNGDPVANFSIGCNENWKDKNGDKQERTEWVRVSAFGKLAEIIGEYLKKGSQVFISGRMQTRKYHDKDGNDRYTTEIVANEMKMLGGKPERSAGAERQERDSHLPIAPKPRPAREPGSDDDFGGDDIPF